MQRGAWVARAVRRAGVRQQTSARGLSQALKQRPSVARSTSSGSSGGSSSGGSPQHDTPGRSCGGRTPAACRRACHSATRPCSRAATRSVHHRHTRACRPAARKLAAFSSVCGWLCQHPWGRNGPCKAAWKHGWKHAWKHGSMDAACRPWSMEHGAARQHQRNRQPRGRPRLSVRRTTWQGGQAPGWQTSGQLWLHARRRPHTDLQPATGSGARCARVAARKLARSGLWVLSHTPHPPHTQHPPHPPHTPHTPHTPQRRTCRKTRCCRSAA
jgi:hypothetical protein